MLIVKDHAGRYSLQQPSGEMIGQILRSEHGWMYRDHRGYGPRRPEVSPSRALIMAQIIGHLRPATMQAPWDGLIAQADRAFSHNQRIATNA